MCIALGLGSQAHIHGFSMTWKIGCVHNTGLQPGLKPGMCYISFSLLSMQTSTCPRHPHVTASCSKQYLDGDALRNWVWVATVQPAAKATVLAVGRGHLIDAYACSRVQNQAMRPQRNAPNTAPVCPWTEHRRLAAIVSSVTLLSRSAPYSPVSEPVIRVTTTTPNGYSACRSACRKQPGGLCKISRWKGNNQQLQNGTPVHSLGTVCLGEWRGPLDSLATHAKHH